MTNDPNRWIAIEFGISVKDFKEHNPRLFEQRMGELDEKISDSKLLKKIAMRYKHDKAHVIWEFLLWAYENNYSLVRDGERSVDDLALIRKCLDERKRDFKKLKYEEVGEPSEVKFIKREKR